MSGTRETSQAIQSAEPPDAARVRAASSRTTPRRPLSTTVAPAAAKASAAPRPSPLPPPVTQATLPERLKSAIALRSSSRHPLSGHGLLVQFQSQPRTLRHRHPAVPGQDGLLRDASMPVTFMTALLPVPAVA